MLLYLYSCHFWPKHSMMLENCSILTINWVVLKEYKGRKVFFYWKRL